MNIPSIYIWLIFSIIIDTDSQYWGLQISNNLLLSALIRSLLRL